jgi:uncharacterized ion transporter superfamily protein YfcC
MKFKMPHPYSLIFSIIIFIALLTYILPAGEFERYKDSNGRTLVKAGSYHNVEKNPQGLTSILMSVVKGIENASGVVGFVLVIGGAFGIISATGAIEAGLNKTTSLLKGKELFIIPLTMIIFSLGGTTFGLCEETLPFYMIFIPLCIGMGYDSITGFMVIFLGAAAGTAASTVNPFAVGIAQAIAELPPGSGADFRFIQYIIYTGVSVAFVMWYANRVKKNPEKSPVYELDKVNREFFLGKKGNENLVTFTGRHSLILLTFAVGIGIMIWGLIVKKWYVEEVSMVFLGIGLMAGIISGFDQKKIAESFVSGCKDLTYAAVIIGLARGILIVAQDGKIIDTILNSAAITLNGLPKPVFVTLMLLFQNIIACFVPSSSGHAALTIPVLSPLGDLIQVHRQVIVTAYHYGSGITNMISPTSGTLMAALGLGKIPWDKWARFIFPMILIYFFLAVLFLITGLSIYPVN